MYATIAQVEQSDAAQPVKQAALQQLLHLTGKLPAGYGTSTKFTGELGQRVAAENVLNDPGARRGDSEAAHHRVVKGPT